MTGLELTDMLIEGLDNIPKTYKKYAAELKIWADSEDDIPPIDYDIYITLDRAEAAEMAFVEQIVRWMINFDRVIIEPPVFPDSLDLNECRTIIIENQTEIAYVFQEILDGEKSSDYVDAEDLAGTVDAFYQDAMNMPY